MNKKVFVFWVIFCKILYASKLDYQEVCFDDIIRAMISDEKDTYGPGTIGSPVSFHSLNGFLIFRGLKITFNRAKDNVWDERFSKGASKNIIIKKGIEFIDCEFPALYWFVLRNFTFEEPVCFRRCKSVFLYFKDCLFMHHLTIRGGEFHFLHAENTQFHLGFNVSEGALFNDYIHFSNCKFAYSEKFLKNPYYVKHQNVLGNLEILPDFLEINNKNNPFSLFFNHCAFFSPDSNRFRIDLSHSAFTNLEFNDCSLNISLNLSFVNVENQFKFRNVQLKGNFLAEALNFNPANSKIDWQQIKAYRIAVEQENGTILNGNCIKSLNDDYYFNTLISVYALLYNCYKSQGNRFSANQCYIEWKDIENEYLNLKKTEKFDLYFFWVMNIFLKTFCDYGTNPIKSMIWSFYVILFFSLIYLFFPNVNNLPDEYLYTNRLKVMFSYFTQNKRISECFYEFKALNSSGDLLGDIKKNKNLPKFIKFFIIPIGLKRFWKYIKINILRKIDHFAGRWNELNTSQKNKVLIFYFFIMIFSFIYVGIIKILNAIMLSLNVFSTLGFGDIPVRGFAKYLTVVEGFIGWFLLSIFSVALISQIIQ